MDIGRTVARLGRHVEVALRKLDLTTAQYRALVQLDEGAEASSSLAAKLAVSRPSVTAVVEGLVQRGLVDRQQSAADRRWVSVQLTEAGRAVLAEADGIVIDRLVNLLSGLGATDAGIAVTGIVQWQVALDEHRARSQAARTAMQQQEQQGIPAGAQRARSTRTQVGKRAVRA